MRLYILFLLLMTLAACGSSIGGIEVNGDVGGEDANMATRIGNPTEPETPPDPSYKGFVEDYLAKHPDWIGVTDSEIYIVKYDVQGHTVTVSAKSGEGEAVVLDFSVSDDGSIETTTRDAKFAIQGTTDTSNTNDPIKMNLNDADGAFVTRLSIADLIMDNADATNGPDIEDTCTMYNCGSTNQPTPYNPFVHDGASGSKIIL